MPRPLFITGLPRSGTTFLHRLMSEDPAGRTMLMWESMEPTPSPTLETYRSDPRVARAEDDRLAPPALASLGQAHELAAEIPEEDNNLFAHDFIAGILGFLFDVPEYIRWLEQQPLLDSYAYHKKQLQILSWKLRGDYWILKAPGAPIRPGRLARGLSRRQRDHHASRSVTSDSVHVQPRGGVSRDADRSARTATARRGVRRGAGGRPHRTIATRAPRRSRRALRRAVCPPHGRSDRHGERGVRLFRL